MSSSSRGSSRGSRSGCLNPDKVGNVWASCVCVCLFVPRLLEATCCAFSAAAGKALLLPLLLYFVLLYATLLRLFIGNPLPLDSPGHAHTDYLPGGGSSRKGVGAGKHGHTSGSHPLRLIQKNYKRCLVSFCLPR